MMIDKVKKRQSLYGSKVSTPGDTDRGKESMKQQRISFEEFEKVVSWPKVFPYLIIEFLIQITDMKIYKMIEERLTLRKIENIKNQELKDHGHDL